MKSVLIKVVVVDRNGLHEDLYRLSEIIEYLLIKDFIQVFLVTLSFYYFNFLLRWMCCKQGHEQGLKRGGG